jgi:DinB superfamily
MVDNTLRINFVTGAARRYIAEVEALAAMPDRVHGALAGLAPAALRHTPAGDEWSSLRIVGHLIAYARQSHENLNRMAWMTDPIIKLTDDEAADEMYAWSMQEPTQLFEWLTESVTESVELLKELPDASWGRPGQHPESGRRSVRQQVAAMVDHFNEHIAQLEARRR